MASKLRTPTLALAALSICLSIAIIGTAGRSLNVFFNQWTTNAWFLPLWPSQFDTRELEMLIGTSGAIALLNAVLAVALLVPKLPANGMVVGSALLSTMVAILSVVFTTVLNYRAPYKDTLKTYTCRWSDRYVTEGDFVPQDFRGLCRQTRFAYYTTIPILVIQAALLVLGFMTLFSRPSSRSYRHHDMEKGHQLRSVGRSESPVSYQDSARILGNAK